MADRIIVASQGDRIARPLAPSRVIVGRRGLSGRTYSGVIFGIPGRPAPGVSLGYYLAAGPQTFTDAASVVGCKIAPTADALLTIWLDNNQVGTATIPAGATRGVVALDGARLAVIRDQMVEALAPVSPDPSLDSPTLTLA